MASPEPLALLELPIIRKLVADCAIVICAGGGGIPVYRGADSRLRWVEAVVDKNLTAALLARDLNADALLFLTDVDGIELGFGPKTIRHCTVSDLHARSFPPGSMGPRADAACRFVETTGKRSMIGRLDHALDVLNGAKGTIIGPDVDRTVATEPGLMAEPVGVSGTDSRRQAGEAPGIGGPRNRVTA